VLYCTGRSALCYAVLPCDSALLSLLLLCAGERRRLRLRKLIGIRGGGTSLQIPIQTLETNDFVGEDPQHEPWGRRGNCIVGSYLGLDIPLQRRSLEAGQGGEEGHALSIAAIHLWPRL